MTSVLKGIAIIVTGLIATPLVVMLGELLGAFFSSEIFPLIRSILDSYIEAWKHVWHLCVGANCRGGESTMKYFYLSLTRGLSGYYVKFEAEREDDVKLYAVRYLSRSWDRVYSDAYFHEIQRKRYPNATRVINNKRPIKLTGEPNQWE